MSVNIEDAREEMLGQIEEIEKLCFSVPWTLEQLRSQLKDPQHEFIAALDPEGRVLGYVGMMYVLDEGYISNVCTAPEHRRRGVASALIDEMISRAAALELAFLSLEVRASNSPAIALYRGKGFVDVGVRPGYYEKPAEDAIIMNLYIRKEPQC